MPEESEGHLGPLGETPVRPKRVWVHGAHSWPTAYLRCSMALFYPITCSMILRDFSAAICEAEQRQSTFLLLECCLFGTLTLSKGEFKTINNTNTSFILGIIINTIINLQL